MWQVENYLSKSADGDPKEFNCSVKKVATVGNELSSTVMMHRRMQIFPHATNKAIALAATRSRSRNVAIRRALSRPIS
jgi:uncharacterized protein (DUF2461 family)